MAIHCSSPRTHFLPGHCHWFSHLGAIGLDTASGKYVEPFQPHHPISVIGLSAHSKSEPALVRTTDGRWLCRLLRYGELHHSYRVNIAIEGTTHAFDGIALPSFRNRVFDAVSRHGGVNFLQIGAMDGVAFDPIRAFVTRFGWHGILVEPIPDLMERLKINYAANDGLVFAPIAIAESSGCRKMSRVRAGAVQEGVLPIWADGISSLTPERTPLCGKKLTPEQARLVDDHLDTIDVDCLDFETFEKKYGVESFDVLQIDTEGYDWNILGQINLGKHSTLCVHMEICCLPPNEIDEALAYLRSMNFACYAMEDGQDLLALRRDFGAMNFGIS
jgi:FkbM family methyltransferase